VLLLSLHAQARVGLYLDLRGFVSAFSCAAGAWHGRGQVCYAS
jgi:hypothetical protein